MLYQNLVGNKIIKCLKFRKEGSLDRCRTLVPDMIRRYQVPDYLRRDVYFYILITYFHGLKDDYVMELLNEAYSEKKISPQTEEKDIITLTKETTSERYVYQKGIPTNKEEIQKGTI